METVRNKIRSFLKIEPPSVNQIVIQQRLDFCTNAIKNRIWYRGNSQEIAELYAQLDVPPTMFWKASSTAGMEIRKIHTGLPALIIKTLANIIVNDFDGIEIENLSEQDIWNHIYQANDGDQLLKQCLTNTLIVGDGAFKIKFDKDIDEHYPIIEYRSGEYVEFIKNGGRVTEVIFITEYLSDGRKYTLKERYGYGYIQYHLYNESGTEINANAIPQTAWIKNSEVTFDKNIMLAVPCIYCKSQMFDGRGESILDSKIDSFDALDEAWSQWLDALRANRTKQYIPESLIPRDINNGQPIHPNSFDNRFIAIGDDMSERGLNKVQTEQSQIPHDSYLATYVTALDLALQGIISPSSLGIDVKKLDNAEAQREKEKATLYTRQNLVQFVDNIMQKLVTSALAGYQFWHLQSFDGNLNINVKFGEYANPSFEAVVETVSKAKQSNIMSLEACVEELYGDSKDQSWKDEEVARLKTEQGVVTPDDDGIATALGDFSVNVNG